MAYSFITKYMASTPVLSQKNAESGLKGKSSDRFRFLMRNTKIKATFRGVVLFSIITYLTYRLSLIGWSDILQSLPSSPLFYILSIAIFFAPVFAEIVAFNKVTAGKIALPFKVFVRKHILNKAILTYSGEAYIIQQLSKTDILNLRSAVIIIKDLALIRTFVANLWVVILVLSAITLGNTNIFQKIALTSPALVIAVGLICIGVCFLAVVFFRKLTTLTFSLGAKIAGVFLLRSLIVAGILTAQWSLAIPGTPLSIWYIFLVVFVITRKSPIGGEFVFVSVALALPGLEDSAAVAAMLMTLIALNQINYFLAFILTSDLTTFKLAKVFNKKLALATPH